MNIFNNFWQVAAPPNISVSPLTVNFGSVTVGLQSSAVITATNTGGPGLVLNSASLSPGSSAFSILSAKKTGTNVSLPVTLANNETVDIEVAFTPSVPGTATRTLVIGSNDADTPAASVQLSGQGVQSQTPPSQQISNILEFFDSSVAAGMLQGNGPGNSAQGRLTALRNMIEAAGDLITAGSLAQACTQLSDAQSRVDGNPRPPDFAVGSATPRVRSLIADLRTSIGCP